MDCITNQSRQTLICEADFRGPKETSAGRTGAAEAKRLDRPRSYVNRSGLIKDLGAVVRGLFDCGFGGGLLTKPPSLSG